MCARGCHRFQNFATLRQAHNTAQWLLAQERTLKQVSKSTDLCCQHVLGLGLCNDRTVESLCTKDQEQIDTPGTAPAPTYLASRKTPRTILTFLGILTNKFETSSVIVRTLVEGHLQSRFRNLAHIYINRSVNACHATETAACYIPVFVVNWAGLLNFPSSSKIVERSDIRAALKCH